MKTIKVAITLLFFTTALITVNAQSINTVYYGKFTLDAQGNVYHDNFSITIKGNQIIYEKNGNVKTFDAIEKDDYINEPKPGIQFKYHQYYLYNKNIYLLISYQKEVKHDGVFYYRIIIDGQTQLAL